MLLHGSYVLQASLLLTIALVSSQSYGSDDDEEHHSSYSDNSDHPDYSKYYKVDTSAPLVSAPLGSSPETESSGFTSPIDFTSFFNTPQFDHGSASAKQLVNANTALVQEPQKSQTGFVTPQDFQPGFARYKPDPFSKDYFEQSQRAQRQEAGEAEYESQPGPNYISYKIPSKVSQYKSEEQESIEESGKYNNEEEGNDKEDFTDKKSAEEFEGDRKAPLKKPTYEFKIDHKAPLNLPTFDAESYLSKIAPKVNEPNLELPLSPAAPYSPQYYAKYTQTPQVLSPYEKFSFQPVTDSYGLKTSNAGILQSTAAPFNPNYSKLVKPAVYESQSTDDMPKSLNLNSKGCRKVNKQISEKDIKTGRFKRQAMDCFVCEDPKSGANYEQCSYSSEPKSDSYFVGSAEKYSKPVSSMNYRYKRAAAKESEEYVNPYDYVKSQSHKYYSKPQEFEADFYKPKDFGVVEEYRFGPEYFDNGKEHEADEEKSYSEQQSEALKANAENCKKVKKSGMTCMVCKNAKTGGNYEQCSYTSAPAEKKYAYVRERKFDKDDNPIQDKVVESADPKEVAEEKHVPKRRYKPAKQEEGEESTKAESRQSRRPQKFKSSPQSQDSSEHIEDSYDVPKHFEKTTKTQKGLGGFDAKLYGSAEYTEPSLKSKKDDAPELEEYEFKLFPKYNKQESKTEEKRVRIPDKYKSFEAEESKKDVESVLEEFVKKDRSNCKKAQRHGMTCYLCVDKKGVEHEECMYIAESQPKASHVAYHEVQKTATPKRGLENEQSESKVKQTQESPSKRKRFYKKATVEAPEIEAEASKDVKYETSTTAAVKAPIRKLRRTKNVPKQMEQAVAESRVDTAELTVGSEEGAYSAETRPVYSRVLESTLPKYMVEKTEYEKSFDEFSG